MTQHIESASSESDLIASDIGAYLERHQQKELLRLVVVGSVDDGKSTLIGRLLHDTQSVFDDQLSAVKRASKQSGVGEIDFSLFTDGLKAEREQGITIDVAYRYFATDKRKFIIADTPGHVQYTRNMATGASTANVALILIDAKLGVLTQSRRHAYIASLLGIPHLAVGINKLDLVDYDRATFDRIRAEFTAFTDELGFRDVTFFPLSALAGDNVVEASPRTRWYQGGSLLSYLETVPIANDRNQDDFRYPVQWVNRPNREYRGFAGQIASGRVEVGDRIVALPSKKESRIVGIDGPDGELAVAQTPMSVTLRLADEIDVSRGDMLVRVGEAPRVARRFDAMLVWMSGQRLDPSRSYFLKHTTRTVRADVEHVAYAKDPDTLAEVPAETLEMNDIGRVTLRCHQSLFVDAYRENRATGAFILIDAITNDTVAAGMVLPAVEEARAPVGPPRSVRPLVSPRVTDAERHERLGQRGAIIWLTGRPGSGKSALANAIERQLFDQGRVAIVIDPSDGRGQASTDGNAPDAAIEAAGRAADAGLIVVMAFASPDADRRLAARSALGENRVVEVPVGQDGRNQSAAEIIARVLEPSP